MQQASGGTSQAAYTLPSRYWEFHFARNVEIPEIEWRIPGFLPVGLTVCVAPPKIGKTWLGMQIEHCLTRGEPLFGHKPDRLSDTLALDLEGNARRTRKRSRILRPSVLDDGQDARDTFYIHANDEAYGQTHSAADRIAWLGMELDAAEAHGHVFTHIRIDTLRLFLGTRPREMNAYDFDTGIGRMLDEFAHSRNVSVLAAHHTKKAGDEEDWLERVSGSTGIAGSASAIWLLDRARGSDEGVLYATLRDGDEVEAPVRFERGRWSFADDVTPAQAKHTKGSQPRQVLDLLTVRAVPLSFAEIASATGIEQRSLTKILDRLRAEGAAESAGGRWRLIERDGLAGDVDSARQLAADEAAPAAPTEEFSASSTSADALEPPTAENLAARNVAINALEASVKAVRAFTVRVIRKDARDALPWSLAPEVMTGRHSWVDEAAVADLAGAGWDAVILDRNAAYPSVMSSVPVATSTLVHTESQPYDPKRAGWYLIDPPTWPVKGRPHPLGLHDGDEAPVWVTAPHMELLTRRGVVPEVLDSWTGQRSSALFERFYKWARQAREEAAAQGPEQLAEVKRQTVVAIRALYPMKDDGRGRLWRPDWHGAVVAEANVRHWVHADAFMAAEDTGGQLVALRNTDEAVIAVPADTGDVAGAVAPYSLGAGYGQYKVKARMSLATWQDNGYRVEARRRG